MHPELIHIGPVTIYSYGVALAIAVFVSVWLLLKDARRQGYDQDVILDISLMIVVAGIVGARLLFVALNLDFFLERPLEIIMVHHGGLAILGGLLGGLLGAFVVIRKKKLSFLHVIDVIIPYVALAHSIGRIGCFFNGCCYGRPSACGVYFPVHDEILIPTQLISSFFLLTLYAVLRLKQRRPHRPGEIFATYGVLYSVMRFLIEFLRNDSARAYFGMTIFQLVCIVFLIVSGTFLLYLKWKNKP